MAALGDTEAGPSLESGTRSRASLKPVEVSLSGPLRDRAYGARVTRWEYAAVVDHAAGALASSWITIHHADGHEERIDGEAGLLAALSHLRRLGALGWELIDREPWHAQFWVETTYLLKRPVA